MAMQQLMANLQQQPKVEMLLIKAALPKTQHSKWSCRSFDLASTEQAGVQAWAAVDVAWDWPHAIRQQPQPLKIKVTEEFAGKTYLLTGPPMTSVTAWTYQRFAGHASLVSYGDRYDDCALPHPQVRANPRVHCI